MTYAQYAQRYRAGERTVKRWAAKGAPLGDDPAMVAWAGGQKNLPIGFLEWLDEQKRGVGVRQPTDSDWAEFEKIARTGDPKEAMEKISKARDFAAFMLEKAWKSQSKADQKHYSDLLAKMEACLHDAQLRARKLGVDQGELVPRAEVIKMIRNWTFWAMRAVDMDLAEICPKVPGIKSVNDARNLLEPWLLSARFVKPFAKAARVESESALSPWMVETVKDAVDDYVENGAKEFEEATESAP